MYHFEIFKGLPYIVVAISNEDDVELFRLDPLQHQWIHLPEFDPYLHKHNIFKVLKDPTGQDDKIFFGGGNGYTDTHYYDGNTITSTPIRLSENDGCHFQTEFLQWDQLLVAGGCDPDCCAIKTSYIIDFTDNLVKPVTGGNLTNARILPTLIKLDSGKVLLAGGYNFDEDQTFNQMELFDPDTDTWTELTQTSKSAQWNLGHWAFVRVANKIVYFYSQAMYLLNQDDFSFSQFEYIYFYPSYKGATTILPVNYFLNGEYTEIIPGK